ncbi:MAG: hypothetical protein OHK0046_40580 [Anaerolineae bacterium]
MLFAFLSACGGDLGPAALPQQQTANTWEVLAPGLERRVYEDERVGALIALRVDPAQYTFRAHYTPGEARRVGEWQAALPEAVAFINSNFYDPDNRVLGLLVADSVVYGQAYRNRGGLFAVQDGIPTIRANERAPYNGEPLEQAVQAFPMLVLDGLQAYTSDAPDRTTRRTAIGQDAQGRVVLMTATAATLESLSAFLPMTDMGLANAFNLDGGGSTMMHIAPEGYTLISRDPVPAVLAIYPRT